MSRIIYGSIYLYYSTWKFSIRPELFVEDSSPPPTGYIWLLYQKSVVYTYVDLCLFYVSILLINVSDFMAKACSFCYCSSVIQIDSGIGMPLEVFLVFRVVLKNQNSLGFLHRKLEYCPLMFCEELRWNIGGDRFESVDWFGTMAGFIVVILL